jgi:hypothetical protein
MTMSNAGQYGTHFWCIVTPEETIMLYADEARIENGTLTMVGVFRAESDEAWKSDTEPQVLLAYGVGKWDTVWAANCLDGRPVSVEHATLRKDKS